MISSMAEATAGSMLGVVLTGMGNDGFKGMQLLKQKGGVTLVQDEATSTIYGMPKACVDGGVADEVLPLGQIGYEIGKFMGIARFLYTDVEKRRPAENWSPFLSLGIHHQPFTTAVHPTVGIAQPFQAPQDKEGSHLMYVRQNQRKMIRGQISHRPPGACNCPFQLCSDVAWNSRSAQFSTVLSSRHWLPAM
jgi:hypothetical protein